MIDKYEMFSAFNAVNEDDLRESAEFLGYTGGRKRGRKVIPTLLVAAVIVSLLVASAAAVGISYHRKKQEELSRQYSVTENNVESYMEYPTSEEEKAGLTVLSSVNDGEVLHIYVDYSPITMEEVREIASPEGAYQLCSFYNFNVNGRKAINSADPYLPDWEFSEDEIIDISYDKLGNEIVKVDPELKLNRLIEQAYDEQTQTMTFALFWRIDGELPEKMEVGIGKGDDVDKYVKAEFVPAKYQPDMIVFPKPIVLTDEETGLEFEFVQAKLSSTGCTWYVRSEAFDKMFEESDNFQNLSEEEQQAALDFQGICLNAFERLERTATVDFADGSSKNIGVSETSGFEDGFYYSPCTWDRETVNMENVVSITIGGEKVNIS